MSKLRPYQETAVQRLMDNKRYGLFIDLGMGKTRIVLEMMNRAQPFPALIIAPLSVARTTWSDEVAKWGYDFKVSRVLGGADARQKALDDEADIYIINKENLPWLYRAMDMSVFETIVVDESSAFKNHKALGTKILAKVSKEGIKKGRRMILLSATPAPNGLTDLWSQAYMLDGGERFGNNITRFRQMFCDSRVIPHINVIKYRVAKAKVAIVKKYMSQISMSLRAKDHLDEMPSLSFHTRRVPPCLDFKRAMSGLKDGYVKVDGLEYPVSVDNFMREMQLTLQISNGIIYTDNGNSFMIHDYKYRALIDLVKEADSPVLIAYNFKCEADIIRSQLNEVCDAEKDVATWERGGSDELLRRWNAGELKAMIAHPASIAHGVNLQDGGSILIWLGPTFNLEHWQQMIGRLHRQGQRKPVRVYTIIGDTDLERRMVDALGRKGITQDDFLSAIRG